MTDQGFDLKSLLEDSLKTPMKSSRAASPSPPEAPVSPAIPEAPSQPQQVRVRLIPSLAVLILPPLPAAMCDSEYQTVQGLRISGCGVDLSWERMLSEAVAHHITSL